MFYTFLSLGLDDVIDALIRFVILAFKNPTFFSLFRLVRDDDY